MYYRRKVLLALVEASGGTLNRTDCQKLLFLFCQYAKCNYYDFFPYKFGGFSFLVFQDKLRLTQLGFLNGDDHFQLCTTTSFIDQLKPKDRAILRSMSPDLENLRGKALLRKVYLDYPSYSCRSEILAETLTPTELQSVKHFLDKDLSPCLFTIGYEGLTIDAYLNKLISNNVRALVDVRKNPNSMKYGFSKSKLRHYVETADIKYFHLPDLGIPSNLRQTLAGIETYERLLKHYQCQILPAQIEAINRIQMLLFEHSRIALTCFEADHHFCHRHKITEHLGGMPDFHVKITHL